MPVDLAQFIAAESEAGESGENKQSNHLTTQRTLDSMDRDSCDSFLQADVLSKI